MNVALLIISCLLFAVAVFLAFRLIVLRLGTDEIRRQLPEIIGGDTNKLISVSGGRSNKKLAAELNVRLAELREKELKFENGDREIKTALTNAAHDLRTPLTAIGGYLDLLETETDKEKRGKYLAVIRERTNTLSKLSEELFVYSVTLDSKPNDAEALDAASVLKECLADFYEAFCAKDITPEICVFPFTVVADKTELSRMFSNIISNALKYSAGDFKVMAVDRKITFSNVAEDVDAIDVSRLFDRFYTVNNGKSSTGLGLSIAKIICERIGGKISAAVDGNRLKITVIF